MSDELGNADNKGVCGNRDCSDSQGCDSPKSLLCVRGERRVPRKAVNDTEDGAKGNEEQHGAPEGMSMPWNIERRDVRVVRGKGS